MSTSPKPKNKLQQMLAFLSKQTEAKNQEVLAEEGPTENNLKTWNEWGKTQTIPVDFTKLTHWQNAKEVLKKTQENLASLPASEWMTYLSPLLDEAKTLLEALKKAKEENKADWPAGAKILAVQAFLEIPDFQKSCFKWILENAEETPRMQVVQTLLPLFSEDALSWAPLVKTPAELMLCLHSFFQTYAVPSSSPLPRFEQLNDETFFAAFVQLWKDENQGPLMKNERSIADFCFSFQQMTHLENEFEMDWTYHPLSSWITRWYIHDVNPKELARMAEHLESQGLSLNDKLSYQALSEWVDLCKHYEPHTRPDINSVRHRLKYSLDAPNVFGMFQASLLAKDPQSWMYIEASLTHERNKEEKKSMFPKSKVETTYPVVDLLKAIMPVFQKQGFLDYQDQNGWSLLHHCVLRQRVELVTWLLEGGMDPTRQTPEGLTPKNLLLSTRKALDELAAKSSPLQAAEPSPRIMLNANLLQLLEKFELKFSLPQAQGQGSKLRL